MEGAKRAAKHTQSLEELWRGPGRAGRSGGGGQEGSQTHSEPGGVVEGARRAAKHTLIREEWWIGARRAGGGGQEGSQTGGVVLRAQSREESIGDATLREKERERERG